MRPASSCCGRRTAGHVFPRLSHILKRIHGRDIRPEAAVLEQAGDMEACVDVSVGSKGDAYDNALAESVIGLFKTEVIRYAGPWRGLDDVEYATLEYVSWFNTGRLLEPLGYLSPAEYEAQFQEQFSGTPDRNNCGWSTQITEPPMNPGRFSA